MFDFGSGELLVIGVVALVVIGPKELPGVLRTVGQAVAKMRRMAGDFQGQFQDALREAELHDAVKSISDIGSSVTGSTNIADALASLPTPAPVDTTPPAELQVPSIHTDASTPAAVLPATPGSAVTDEKPVRKRSAKAKAHPEHGSADNPQAALFDTLETMAKKDKDKGKAKPKAEPKPVSKSALKSAAKRDPDAAPKVKARKPKAGTKGAAS